MKQLFAILCLLCTFELVAQQDPQFSQYMFNHQFFNPAATGADGRIRFQLMNRSQWSNYTSTLDGNGGPTTQLFTAALPLNQFKSAIGLVVFNDQIAAEINQQVALTYAYKYSLSNGNVLSAGVKAGFYRKALDGNRFRPVDPNDPRIPLGRSVNQTQMDLGLGLYYNAPDYYVGLSIEHLNQPNFAFDVSGQNLLASTLYLTAGYRYYLSDDLEVNPSVLVRKTSGAPMALEGGLMLTYQDRYWLAGSYRLNDAGIAMVGTNLLADKSLRLGFAYDLTIAGSNAKAPFSYEIMLGYSLPAPKAGKKSIVRTPRFRYQ